MNPSWHLSLSLCLPVHACVCTHLGFIQVWWWHGLLDLSIESVVPQLVEMERICSLPLVAEFYPAENTAMLYFCRHDIGNLVYCIWSRLLSDHLSVTAKLTVVLCCQDCAEEAGTQVTGGQTVINPWLTVGGVATTVCQPNEYILWVQRIPNNPRLRIYMFLHVSYALQWSWHIFKLVWVICLIGL